MLANRHAGASRVDETHRFVGNWRAGNVAMAKARTADQSLHRECGPCDVSRGRADKLRIMRTAFSSDGSSTLITWKRRVSAGSFSKYFLYSAQVVAAIVRSVPRASAGLSKIRGVALTGRSACPDERVRFVDE